MNKLINTLIFLTILSCAPSKELPERRCVVTLQNDYVRVLIDKFTTAIDKDTITLNEVKYECTRHAMAIGKGMYDRFGKWDEMIFNSAQKTPLLLWNHVQLFPNDSTEYIVAATGIENMETIYTSALVFDQHNKDLLADNSEYQVALLNYFSDMIKANDSKKEDFYEAYWTEVDPKYWKKIKKWKRMYENNHFNRRY